MKILSKFIVYLKGLIFLISFSLSLEAQEFANVEIILKQLTLEEKIGQLFVIPACPLREEDHLEDLQRLICSGQAGGILLKQGTSSLQRDFIDRLQKRAKVPLLCVQDGEWGVAMRLSDAIALPRNLTLGAVQDLSLLFHVGREIGRQCVAVGAHINLAPVVDVNSNPRNPIIHMRSFGEDPLEVAKRGEKVMQGMQAEGIIACTKHFPGHGNTAVDSHLDLPRVESNRNQLQQVELLPFVHLIDSGVKAVMSAHLFVGALAEEALLPATFSRRIVGELLRQQMGFKGLIISDALNMRALAKDYLPAEIALRALLAGHDLLLYGDHIAPNIDQILRRDVPEAVQALKSAVANGEIAEELIDQRVRKVLEAKQALGLFEKQEHRGEQDVNSGSTLALKKRLFQEAITVVRNAELLPLKGDRIALVTWGESATFTALMKEKRDVDVLDMADPELIHKLKNYSCAILALSKLSSVPPDFNVGSDEQVILSSLENCSIPIAAVLFGTPYSLAKVPLFSALVVAYENEREAQEAAAEVILGEISPKGKLPVTVAPHFKCGDGLHW